MELMLLAKTEDEHVTKLANWRWSPSLHRVYCHLHLFPSKLSFSFWLSSQHEQSGQTIKHMVKRKGSDGCSVWKYGRAYVEPVHRISGSLRLGLKPMVGIDGFRLWAAELNCGECGWCRSTVCWLLSCSKVCWLLDLRNRTRHRLSYILSTIGGP